MGLPMEQRRTPPTVIRQNRRCSTAPPTVLTAVATEVGAAMKDVNSAADLQLPDTAEVRRHLSISGPGTSIRDVALSICRRLLENAENDPAEILFISDCLKAGSAKTAMPCGLLAGAREFLGSPAAKEGDEDDDVHNYLVRTYGRGDDTPASTVSYTALSCRSHNCSCKGQAVRKSSGPNCNSTECHDAFFPPGEAQDPKEVPRWPAQVPDGTLEKLGALMGDNFNEWAFDTFALSKLTGGRSLQFVGWEALRRGNFFTEFNISPAKAQRFLQRLETSYLTEKDTPYHNSLHAADVTQSVHSLLMHHGLSAYFEHLSLLALILSAMVHDVGHDGRNNAFHVNSQDDLALTYNDRSVQENFHVSTAFKLLKDPEINLLHGLEKEQFVHLRKDMIDAVLGTDMAHHFCQVDNLKTFVERLDRDPADWQQESGSLSALQSMVLHAADIANPGKPLELSDRWVELLKEEFFAQGDLEKSLGLQVSMLCDRESVRFASSQVGFIQFIVRPTFDLLAQVVPQVEDTVLKDIRDNIAAWEARKKVEEREAAECTVICKVPGQLSNGRKLSSRTTETTELEEEVTKVPKEVPKEELEQESTQVSSCASTSEGNQDVRLW